MASTTISHPVGLSKGMLWLGGFVLLEFFCQLVLLTEAAGAIRVIIRSMAIGISLGLLFIMPSRATAHPARTWAILVMVLLVLQLCHPTGNSTFAALAQIGMYLAVLAPLFWVNRLPLRPSDFRLVIFLFWGFHTCSAFFGLLQIYFPGQFQPSITTIIRNNPMEGYLESFQMTLSDGSTVFRPMGLTDTPGGAGNSGLFATLLGLGILLIEKPRWLRGLGMLGMVLGLFCIYLSQVRTTVVLTGICVAMFIMILWIKGEYQRASIGLLVFLALAVGSLAWSLAVGGETVSARLSTLTEESPDDVYYRNRGRFLENTIEVLLPKYPLGAGMGRWGMMNSYFGDNSDPESASLWVEIMWTGWLLDGGIPLILFYSLALLMTCVGIFRIAMSRRPDQLPLWAALVLGYNVGILALTFSYPVFIGQAGLDFWLLNSALFVAAARSVRRARLPRPYAVGAITA